MTNYAAKTVDDYIASTPDECHAHLLAIRAAIRAGAPAAEEGIHWGKPWFQHHGMIAGFDAFRKHVSVEIWTDELGDADRESLESKGYKTGKRTFQIRYDQDVPSAIIRKLVAARAKDNAAKAAE